MEKRLGEFGGCGLPGRRAEQVAVSGSKGMKVCSLICASRMLIWPSFPGRLSSSQVEVCPHKIPVQQRNASIHSLRWQ